MAYYEQDRQKVSLIQESLIYSQTPNSNSDTETSSYTGRRLCRHVKAQCLLPAGWRSGLDRLSSYSGECTLNVSNALYLRRLKTLGAKQYTDVDVMISGPTLSRT